MNKKLALTMRTQCEDTCCDACPDMDIKNNIDLGGYAFEAGDRYDLDICNNSPVESFEKNYIIENKIEEEKKVSKNEIKKEEKKEIKFDEIILDQDIIEGCWKKDDNIDVLIKGKKDLYEIIKTYSDNKNIKDENGIITLFIIYYIFKERNEKVGELKFIINKAKNYIKKIFNLEYEEIIKEIESK